MNDQGMTLFKSNGLPQPGIYHYYLEEQENKTRVHLRIDPDESGLLIINANRVVHLNPSAALMTYFHLEEKSPPQAIRALRKKFNVSHRRAKQDFRQFETLLDEVLDPHGGCPICELELETTAPFSAQLTAPYRMDFALTYRCNNDCSHCYNARPRRFPEMPLEQWKQAIDKVWDLSIPHIVFTGGEPTLYHHLPELVAYAEAKGVITGLNTNGRKLADQNFLNQLLDAGLDLSLIHISEPTRPY